MSVAVDWDAASSKADPDLLGITIPQARRVIVDLQRRRPVLYWCDLLLSMIGGWGFLTAAIVESPRQTWATLLFVPAGFLLYRATLFVHEIAHFRARELRGFELAWNILVGIPLLMPSFMYDLHRYHHASRSYGTTADGEYVRLDTHRVTRPLVLMASAPLALPLLMTRFAVLGPASWVSPRVRRVVRSRFSGLVIDIEYRRPGEPTGPDAARWNVLEVATSFWLAAAIVATVEGAVPLRAWMLAWAALTLATFVNFARVLVAHRYRGSGVEMSHAAQVLDSLDHPSAALAWLWAPVGLRYHAVHHLFPHLPYHSLGEAWRRLQASLPSDAAYRRCESSGLPRSMCALARRNFPDRRQPC